MAVPSMIEGILYAIIRPFRKAIPGTYGVCFIAGESLDLDG